MRASARSLSIVLHFRIYADMHNPDDVISPSRRTSTKEATEAALAAAKANPKLNFTSTTFDATEALNAKVIVYVTSQLPMG